MALKHRGGTPGIPGRFFAHAVSNPETRTTIGQRFIAGETAEALAAIFSVSPRTVRRYAAETTAEIAADGAQ